VQKTCEEGRKRLQKVASPWPGSGLIGRRRPANGASRWMKRQMLPPILYAGRISRAIDLGGGGLFAQSKRPLSPGYMYKHRVDRPGRRGRRRRRRRASTRTRPALFCPSPQIQFPARPRGVLIGRPLLHWSPLANCILPTILANPFSHEGGRENRCHFAHRGSHTLRRRKENALTTTSTKGEKTTPRRSSPPCSPCPTPTPRGWRRGEGEEGVLFGPRGENSSSLDKAR